MEVEWFQSPPMLYHLKLKLKITSNHETANGLPLSERPEFSSSLLSSSMGPLDGIYRRVTVLPSIRISGSDYNRIRESSIVTRLECCQIDGSSTLLIALLIPSHKRTAKVSIRYLSLDLDSVQMLPWVTRLQPSPIPTQRETHSLTASTPAPTSPPSNNSLALDHSVNHSSRDSYLKSIIGDDYVPTKNQLTWRDAGHVSSLSSSTASNSNSTQYQSQQYTDAQLLSASVVSKQTVVVAKEGVARIPTTFDADVSEYLPPRRSRTPKSITSGENGIGETNGAKDEADDNTRFACPSEQTPSTSDSTIDSTSKNSKDIPHVNVTDATYTATEGGPSQVSASFDTGVATSLEPVAASDSVSEAEFMSSAHLQLNVTPADSETVSNATPAPSTPTSTSSSFSVGRTPREVIESMAREVEVSYFNAEATCFALNRATSNWKNFETVVGFANGIILKYDPKVPRSIAEKEPAQTKWKTFNDSVKMFSGPVRRLSWFTHNQFMVSFSDGFIYVMHLQCEDDPHFTREDADPRRLRSKRFPSPSSTSPESSQNGKSSSSGSSGSSNGVSGKPTKSERKPGKILVDNVPIPYDGWLNEWMWLRVHNPSSSKMYNPIGMWAISPGAAVTDFAISADLKYLASTSKDGVLRIHSMDTYELVVAFKSYFGGLTCLAWSPDGQYIATGGEDDLVSLFSISERTLVARGEAHNSWISKIAFDPHRCSSKSYYRFASVGQDCQVAIWEFSADTLELPKLNLLQQQKMRRRLSMSQQHQMRSSASSSNSDSIPSTSTVTSPEMSSTTQGSHIPPLSSSAQQMRTTNPTMANGAKVHIIPPLPKDEACRIEPVIVQRVTTSPCSEVQFIGGDLLFVGGWAGQCAFFLLETNTPMLSNASTAATSMIDESTMNTTTTNSTAQSLKDSMMMEQEESMMMIRQELPTAESSVPSVP